MAELHTSNIEDACKFLDEVRRLVIAAMTDQSSGVILRKETVLRPEAELGAKRVVGKVFTVIIGEESCLTKRPTK